jgi:quercetin dioxygenase-like cupin family protein
MIKAYRLFTAPDGNSQVERGRISTDVLVEAEVVQFKETAAHSSGSWSNDPVPQYVLTLAGILEVTTRNGDTFTIYPGDVLLAAGNAGSGHAWRLINDEPWKRACIVFKAGADPHFSTESAFPT